MQLLTRSFSNGKMVLDWLQMLAGVEHGMLDQHKFILTPFR